VAKFLKGALWVAGIIGLITLVLRIFLFKVWTIPNDAILGASLAPTLASGDVVLVLTRGERGLGDLVRCADPEDAQRWVIGRIYGIEGDRVSVSNGFVTVNGRRYTTTESCVEDTVESIDPRSGAPIKVACSRVELGGGWHFMGSSPGGSAEAPREHTVGPGRYYLISDNRSNHEDSRDFGAVLKETCVDRITFRLWGKEGFGDAKRRFDVIR
jgi:signal peptidase I